MIRSTMELKIKWLETPKIPCLIQSILSVDDTTTPYKVTSSAGRSRLSTDLVNLESKSNAFVTVIIKYYPACNQVSVCCSWDFAALLLYIQETYINEIIFKQNTYQNITFYNFSEEFYSKIINKVTIIFMLIYLMIVAHNSSTKKHFVTGICKVTTK